MGWWLAGNIDERSRPISAQLAHQITESERDLLISAANHFSRILERPQIAPLLRGYRDWNSAIESAAASIYLGPFPEEAAYRALEVFLPAWRMALDLTIRSISRQFGSTSSEAIAFKDATVAVYDSNFGYRIVEAFRNAYLHSSIPHLRQNVSVRRYRCEHCGKEHAADPRLSVELPASHLLTAESCPATVKRELADSDGSYINLPAVIDEAMAGMFDVLLAVALMDPDGSIYLQRLSDARSQTGSDEPVVVHMTNEHLIDEICPLSSGTWAVERANLGRLRRSDR